MAKTPPWLQRFLDRLATEDRSAATRRGYRYDLLQFITWYTGLHGTPPDLPRLTEHDIIAWRQHMLTLRQLKAATINRRLEAVRRLLRWAETSGAVAINVARDVRTVRLTCRRQPIGLTAAEVHALLRILVSRTQHRAPVYGYRRGAKPYATGSEDDCHAGRARHENRVHR